MATAYTAVRKKTAGEIAHDAGLDANTNAVSGAVYAVGAKAIVLQVVPISGAHANHVTKLQGSLNNVDFVDTTSSVTKDGAVTLSDPDFVYYRAKITTVEGAASSVDTFVSTLVAH
jgi:hypothetical protein